MSEEVAALQRAENVRMDNTVESASNQHIRTIDTTHILCFVVVHAETFRSDGCGDRNGLEHQARG